MEMMIGTRRRRNSEMRFGRLPKDEMLMMGNDLPAQNTCRPPMVKARAGLNASADMHEHQHENPDEDRLGDHQRDGAGADMAERDQRGLNPEGGDGDDDAPAR